MEPAYNSWAIVPVGHVLSHVANLPAANVRELDYEVYQLKMPNTGRVLPFLIMDLWTLHAYARETVETALMPVDANRVPLTSQWLEIVPLTSKSWIESCTAGQEYHVGTVTFKVVITYTTFVKDFRSDARLLPVLSDGFPKLQAEFKNLIDSDQVAAAPKKQGRGDAMDDGE